MLIIVELYHNIPDDINNNFDSDTSHYNYNSMDSLQHFLRTFILCIATAVFASCEGIKCDDPRYDLEAYITISPARRIYYMSDTVLFRIEMPRSALNRINGRYVNIKLFDVGYELFVSKLDSVAEEDLRRDDTYGNVDVVSSSNNVDFDFIPKSIYFRPTLEEDSLYASQFSFTFKQSGVYFMELNSYTDEDFYYNGENLKDNILVEDQCRKARFDLFNKVNGGGDNNVDILCETQPIICSINNLLDRKAEVYDREGGYVFKVVK